MKAVFSRPEIYDLAFQGGEEDLAGFVRQVLGEATSGATALVPACGTGRYAYALAQQGYGVVAFDIEQEMISRARWSKRHPLVRYLVDDMVRMPMVRALVPRESFEAAFLLNNSFRYLLTREDAEEHLDSVRKLLNPGGSYVLEVGLNDHAGMTGESARWVVQHGAIQTRASWTLRRFESPIAFDLARIEVLDEEGNVREEMEEEQLQLTWSFDALSAAAERTGFAVDRVFHARTRKELHGAASATCPGKYLVILRKKCRTH